MLNMIVEKHCKTGKKLLHLDSKRMCSFQGTLILNFGCAQALWVYCNFTNMDSVTGLLCWHFLGISGRWPKCYPFRIFFLQKCKNMIIFCYPITWRCTDPGGIWFVRAEPELPRGSCIGNSSCGLLSSRSATGIYIPVTGGMNGTDWWVLYTGHKIGAGPLGFYSCFSY